VLEPASAAVVLSGTVTTAAKGPAVPEVDTSDAGGGQTRVTVAGRILIGSEPRVLQRRVVTPEIYFAQTFKQVLAKRGITIDKPVREAVLKQMAKEKVALPANTPVDNDPSLRKAYYAGFTEGWKVLISHDGTPTPVTPPKEYGYNSQASSVWLQGCKTGQLTAMIRMRELVRQKVFEPPAQ